LGNRGIGGIGGIGYGGIKGWSFEIPLRCCLSVGEGDLGGEKVGKEK